MSHVLIVGLKTATFKDYLLSHGHTYTLLQDIKKTRFPDKKFKNRIVVDFSSQTTVLAAIDKLKQPADAVISTYENYIVPTAWIAEHLGLPGLPISTAEACTDKYLMRTLFADAPEKISPAFATITSEADVRAFAEQHGFPIIMKPANLAKSLLVTKSSTMDELIANYRHSTELLASTYKKYASTRAPKLIIEEFMEGNIHSVDAFVTSDGTPYVLEQVVDYQTGYDIGYDDNFHYSRILPSKLSDADQTALRHCAEIGIRALSIKNSPAHVEIIMTKAGPRIVEIGARNGGYRERMHKLANGIDITGAALSLALGKVPEITATKNDSCAVLELFPKNPGIFRHIQNEDTLQTLPSLKYLAIKLKPGEVADTSSNGSKMCAIIILANSDHAQFEHDLTYINNNVRVITDAD